MTSSRALWNSLQGILCVYKPADLSISSLKKVLIRRIVSESNEIVGCREPRLIQIPVVEEHPRSGALVVVGEKEQYDYSAHPLVVGELLRSEDLRLEELSYMEPSSSGICLLGINDGCDTFPSILERGWPSEYRVEAMLGRQTRNNEVKGRVTLKVDYDHITKHKLQKLLTKVQSHYRRSAFECADVDLSNEDAFEMARKGIPRSRIQGAQIFYSLDVTLFRPPYFALNMSCAGEDDQFIRNFVNEVGISLGSTASPIRLIRRGVGPFRSNHALLENQMGLQNVIRNISLCNRIIQNSSLGPVISYSKQQSEEASSPKEVIDAVGISQTDRTYDAMKPAWPREYL